MSTSPNDPQDVVNILCSVASGQDVGNSLSRLIQKSFGQEHAPNSVKSLAADLVHLGSVHDNHWEIIIQCIKERLSSSDSDSQMSALNLIPSIPPRYLTMLVLRDGLGNFMVSSVRDANPVVRASAISAFGYFLTQQDVIEALAESSKETEASLEHWQSILDALVDPENQVSGSAFHAIQLLMQQDSTLPTQPSSVLVNDWFSHCLHSLERNLSSVLYRAQELDPDGLVGAIQMVSLMGSRLLTRSEQQEEATQQSKVWIIPVIGQFLEKQLVSVDLAVVSKAASSLLQFCAEASESVGVSWGVAASVSLPTWSLKAINSLENLWESKESVPARADICLTICQHLKQVDLVEVGDISRRLLQKISLLPNSNDRIKALKELWYAVLVVDLKVRRLHHSRGDLIPGVSLQSIIESPFFTGVVAGHLKNQMDLNLSRIIQKASYAAYKQELVTTLVKVMMDYSKKFDFQATFPARVEESAGKEVSLETAILNDIQTDVMDWFAATVVALYLTQACLGWDNVVQEGLYGLTLPSDLWLQQLQLTSQILYIILRHFQIFSFAELRGLDEERMKTRTGKILKTLSSEAFEIQKLMKRMVFYWSFLNDALKPRVFWIVCHHIELPDRVEDLWNHLQDCLKDLLITKPTELNKRQQKDRIAASKEGHLSPESDSVYSLKTSQDPKIPAIAVDQSEVVLEGITVGLHCLGILTEVLMSQYSFIRFPCYYDNVKKISSMLKDVCQQVLDEEFLTVDMFDQCQSIIKQLDYLTETQPEGYGLVQSTKEDTTEGQDEDQTLTFLPIDLSVKSHEGYPFSNSKSLSSLLTKKSKRYRALHRTLYQSSKSEKTPSRRREVPPVPSKPTSVDLATAVGGIHLKEKDSDWRIITGQGDPVQLSLRHKLDAYRRTLLLEMSAENKIGSDITGVVVSFAIEGSVATYREGMIVWYPEKLQANDPVRHEVELGLIEFGVIEIQPFMEVCLQGEEDDFSSLSCAAYSIPLVDLLIPITTEISPKVYFQEMCSWPDSINTTAVCRWAGTNGGLQLLSALNKPKLKKIWPKKRNSLSFFQAIYLVQTFNQALVSLSITGQLVDLRQMGLGVWAVPPENESEGGNVGYYVCKCTFASTSPKAIGEIRSKTDELLSDLTDGGLIPGLDPGVGRPPAPPPIHPEVHVEIKVSEEQKYTTDLQSLALEEWKRLNGVSEN